MAIIVAAPGSRGGKHFWIDWGRISQALNGEKIFFLELGPNSIRLPARRFDIRRGSLESFLWYIAEILATPHPAGESARLEHEFQEYLSEWADDERVQERAVNIANPVALAAGRHLYEAERLQPDIARLLDIGASASMFFDDSRHPVYIPLSVYLSDWEPVRSENSFSDFLSSAIEQIIASLGLEVVARLPTVYGSRWERFILKVRSVVGAPEVREHSKRVLREIEYGLKQATIGKEQAEIDNLQADSFHKIMQGMRESKSGVVQFGSVIVYKDGDTVMAKSLTVDEMVDQGGGNSLEGFISSAVKAIKEAKDEGVKQSALPGPPPALGAKKAPALSAGEENESLSKGADVRQDKGLGAATDVDEDLL